MRRIGLDGSIQILCNRCGKVVMTLSQYPGFSTVTCADCKKALDILKQETEKKKIKP